MAAFDSLPGSDGGVSPACGHLFSDRFLARLTDEERAGLVLRPVQGPPDSGREFFELLGQPLLEFVGLPDFPGRIGGTCAGCGPTSFTYIADWKVANFVAASDLPAPLPPVFGVRDDLGDTRLAMTLERYLELRPGPGMENILAAPLYVAPGEVLRRKKA